MSNWWVAFGSLSLFYCRNTPFQECIFGRNHHCWGQSRSKLFLATLPLKACCLRSKRVESDLSRTLLLVRCAHQIWQRHWSTFLLSHFCLLFGTATCDKFSHLIRLENNFTRITPQVVHKSILCQILLSFFLLFLVLLRFIERKYVVFGALSLPRNSLNLI